MAEFVSYAPDRLFGAIWLPATGIRDAIAEFERFIGTPGMIGPVINCYPNGTTALSRDDDPLWKLLADADIPLNIHVDLRDKRPAMHTERISGGTRNRDAEKRMLEFMWEGVLDRYPNFKIVFAEVDAGWVPFFKEQIDNRYHRQMRGSGIGLSMAPSKYFDRHYHYTFITDTYAIRNRDAVGVRNMLWSDDFPHMGGDWPYTQRSLGQYFGGIPAEDRDLIQAGNAVRLYHLPGRLA
jgi:predicted TIM-barrel fold metal-dependent hydrolase